MSGATLSDQGMAIVNGSSMLQFFNLMAVTDVEGGSICQGASTGG
jgi:hypothetical protein